MDTRLARCALLVLLGLAAPALAKDIKIGGGDRGATVVELPTIAVAIRDDDGGWRHIKVDAWLQSKDSATAAALEAVKTTIIAKADRELPNHDFATLQSPQIGTTEIKHAIHAAAEAGLGRKWNGEVLIHNLLIY